MTEKKASQFKQASFRLHKTVLKTIREIARLYQYDGIKKLTQTDHCGMAILYYAKSLKDKKIKPGDDIENQLFDTV